MKCSILEVFLVIAVAFLSSCAEHSSRLQPTGTAVNEKGEIAAPSAADFEGTIGKIEKDKGLITVQRWPLSKTFKVPPECQIDNLKKSNAVLTQLKVGDAVIVSYSEGGKDLVANRIVRKGKAQNQKQNEKLERLDKMLNPSPNQ